MHPLTRRARRLAAAALAALVAAPLVAPAQAEPSAPPSLRLFATRDDVELVRYRGRVYLQLGVWATPVGGDFDLRAQRPDFGRPVVVSQLDPATGDVVRTLPSDAASSLRGLDDFVVVTLRDDGGEVVAEKSFWMCPNADRQRVDGEGRDVSRFPEFCDDGSVFFKGNRWGIDDHWAIDVMEAGPSWTPRMRAPAGDFEATVRIADRYADALGVAPEDATVTLQVTVRDYRDRGAPQAAAEAADGGGETPVPHAGVPTVEEPPAGTAPDLVALPAWRLQVGRDDGRDHLGFASTLWNDGPAPLVVEGYRRAGEDVMDAFQYFYDASGEPVARTPAGTIEFDHRRGHHHWHMTQFVEYSLVDALTGDVVRSKKQSFCLVPTDPIDLSVPGAEFYPWNDGRRSRCGGFDALWIREHIPAGWGDTYYQRVAGQAFDVTNLPNGWYRARIEVNPTGVLHERTTDNNVDERLLYLKGEPGSRRVRVAPWKGLDI
ncbi:MAG TPA: lysyl oxidase family protein [Actinomycetota bacterium]|nr:lysyl oxidase family protein [Actinomycetota bacterium]